VLGIAFNVDADEIGVVLLGEYWHLNAEMKSSVRAGSWTWLWAMDCWDASSIRLVGRSMATAGGLQQTFARRTACRAHHGPRARLGASPDRIKVIDALIPVGPASAS